MKSALDWVVGGGELYSKPVALFSASLRATYVQAALMETLTTMGAGLVAGASITVPLQGDHRDEASIVSDPVTASTIRAALVELVGAISSDFP